MCELPSPEGGGFKFRFKPVRVGLAADLRALPSPSGRRAGDEGISLCEIDLGTHRAQNASLTLRPLPEGEGIKFLSPKGEGFTDPLSRTLNGNFRPKAMFDITPDDISKLNDTDLRELVGRLCEAELVSRGLSAAAVTWGGTQTAKDGGLDVRVTLPPGADVKGFVLRPSTGFQVK